MKLLITGGAGSIGSYFIGYWLNKNSSDHIINLDALTYAGNLENTKSFKDNPNYKFIHGNILDTKLVNSLMKGIDTVVHFAAETHVDRSLHYPQLFLETNVIGTQVLLEASLNHKIKRFHYISTDEVFGELELNTKEKFTEETPYDPRSPYSSSKAGADHLVMAYYHTYKLPITITNCSNNYGPYQGPEKFIPRSITNLIEDKPIIIYGDGNHIRDWLHVEDHCTAIEVVLKKSGIGETYLVGGLTKDVSNLDIAKLLLKLLDKNKNYIKFVADRRHDRRYAVNWSKINKELGWKPKHTFEAGLKETVEWYKNNIGYWKESKKEVEKFLNTRKKT